MKMKMEMNVFSSKQEALLKLKLENVLETQADGASNANWKNCACKSDYQSN